MDLVNQVKDIQRNSAEGKRAWWQYADEQGGSMRDPAKHDPSVLLNFVSQYHSGAFQGIQGPSQLTALFKEAQRSAPAFKNAWASYVRSQGLSGNDPSKNSTEALVQFLEYLGQTSMVCMAMMNSGGNGNGAMKMLNEAMWSGGHGMKRPNMTANSWDPEKDALVEQIKNFQRSGEENKEAWWSYCDENGFKKRDPALQSLESLQMFCAIHGVASEGEPVMKKSRMATVIDDPWKRELIEKIKAYQRSGEDCKLDWWSFCDQQELQKRDPALQSIEILQEFCGSRFL